MRGEHAYCTLHMYSARKRGTYALSRRIERFSSNGRTVTQQHRTTISSNSTQHSFRIQTLVRIMQGYAKSFRLFVVVLASPSVTRRRASLCLGCPKVDLSPSRAARFVHEMSGCLSRLSSSNLIVELKLGEKQFFNSGAYKYQKKR